MTDFLLELITSPAIALVFAIALDIWMLERHREPPCD